MNLPQSGILPEASSHAIFLTLRLKSGDQAVAGARHLLGAAPRLTGELATAYPNAGLFSVVAVGADCWQTLVGTPNPKQLSPLRERRFGDRVSPSTPADLMVHIRSERRDLNFELERRILAAAEDSIEVIEERVGFRYLDSRDLTGFVDGTENPEGDERSEVALVGDEDPEHAGGSYVILQRYVHDLERWQQLPQAEQEGIIGRTKDTDEELGDDIKPESAHIARVVIEEDGEELEILRHSMPWGHCKQAGLMFIAYTRQQRIFDKMLDSMFDTQHSGVHDRLMEFTRAETGAYFFAPSLTEIERLRS